MSDTVRKIRGIYVITDEHVRPGRTHLEIAHAALIGGASVVQLRDKVSEDVRLVEIGRRIVDLARRYNAIFIVNDRVSVALTCGAHGVHVGQEDMSPSEVRRLMPEAIIGVSASTVEEAMRAEQEGADYVAVGPIFPTETKQDAGQPVGLERIAEVRSSCRIPIVAIGGISLKNLREVVQAGADAIAVISAVVCAGDMIAATRALVEAFESATSDFGSA